MFAVSSARVRDLVKLRERMFWVAHTIEEYRTFEIASIHRWIVRPGVRRSVSDA
jgi:hypothetical protein